MNKPQNPKNKLFFSKLLGNPVFWFTLKNSGFCFFVEWQLEVREIMIGSRCVFILSSYDINGPIRAERNYEWKRCGRLANVGSSCAPVFNQNFSLL